MFSVSLNTCCKCKLSISALSWCLPCHGSQKWTICQCWPRLCWPWYRYHLSCFTIFSLTHSHQDSSLIVHCDLTPISAFQMHFLLRFCQVPTTFIGAVTHARMGNFFLIKQEIIRKVVHTNYISPSNLKNGKRSFKLGTQVTLVSGCWLLY